MIQETSLLLSSGALGIFLGAQIVEAFLFVPNWKSLKADDFFDFYESYGKKIHQFFAPLTIATIVIVLITVGYGFINQAENQMFFVLMGLSTLAFFSTYFLYFKNANQKFADRTLSNAELPGELVRWGNWHWARILFEAIAFICSILILLTYVPH